MKTEFRPTIENCIKEIDNIIRAGSPQWRGMYATLFQSTEIQRLIFETKDFEEAATEYCREAGWGEPQ